MFACEPRNQGDSDKDAEYEPLQWVTDKDVADMRAAVRYLLARPDADPRGVGLFGISKGGSTGLVVAPGRAPHPVRGHRRRVRHAHHDGAVHAPLVQHLQTTSCGSSGPCRSGSCGIIGLAGVRKAAKHRRVTYPSVEKAVRKLRRPLLMIHGEGDTYIKPEMAQALFADAAEPKELWVVPKARHNQALQLAGDEYHGRVVAFFDKHLAEEMPAANDTTDALSQNSSDPGERGGVSPRACGRGRLNGISIPINVKAPDVRSLGGLRPPLAGAMGFLGRLCQR